MADTIRARFSVDEWLEAAGDSADAQAGVSRATVRKKYTERLIGTAVAQIIMTRNGDGAAYTAIERFEGTLDGEAGSISFLHGGIHAAAGDESIGKVVPGSGAGVFSGALGKVELGRDDQGEFLDVVLDR